MRKILVLLSIVTAMVASAIDVEKCRYNIRSLSTKMDKLNNLYMKREALKEVIKPCRDITKIRTCEDNKRSKKLNSYDYETQYSIVQTLLTSISKECIDNEKETSKSRP